jgi:hypothetical protein
MYAASLQHSERNASNSSALQPASSWQQRTSAASIGLLAQVQAAPATGFTDAPSATVQSQKRSTYVRLIPPTAPATSGCAHSLAVALSGHRTDPCCCCWSCATAASLL